MLKAFYALMLSMPEILKLIKTLQENQKKYEHDRKVKQDIETINKAFKEQDAKALNSIFNSDSDL
ncbi:MAG: hypothetical protein H0X02_08815 [Nitrosomonas sp.]|nr:hypothetical protein [Nitrosomonas sp.]